MLCGCWTTVSVFITQISLFYSVAQVRLITLVCMMYALLRVEYRKPSIPALLYLLFPWAISYLLHIFRYIHCYHLLMKCCLSLYNRLLCPMLHLFHLKSILNGVHTVSPALLGLICHLPRLIYA